MIYDERLHTPSALAGEIDMIYSRQPNALLVGSLGRAVIFGNLIGNSTAEFEARLENPVMKQEQGDLLARDVDVIAPATVETGDLLPFEVDQKAFGSRQVRFVHESGTWYLVSDSKGVYEELHPAVMEPVEGETVFGTRALTVPLQTHQALFGLKGAMRPKDQATRAFIGAYDGKNKTPLPQELYEPFDKLRKSANSGWFYHTRNLYRSVIPEPVRRAVVPVTDPVKQRLT